jgi:hypothetical protein
MKPIRKLGLLALLVATGVAAMVAWRWSASSSPDREVVVLAAASTGWAMPADGLNWSSWECR